MADTTLTVIKRDADGQIMLSYPAVLVARGETWVCVDARFTRDDVRASYVTFCKGDRMREWFSTDQWFNIFELHDVRDDHLKGWYCNITRPAIISETEVSADDLALDVFISAAGMVTLIDEDEFAALELSPVEQAAAWDAVGQLRQMLAERRPPFDQVSAG